MIQAAELLMRALNAQEIGFDDLMGDVRLGALVNNIRKINRTDTKGTSQLNFLFWREHGKTSFVS